MREAMRRCMPDFIFGMPDHPGSPCDIIEEVPGPRWWEICLTCGRTDLDPPRPPWWMWYYRGMWERAIEKGPENGD